MAKGKSAKSSLANALASQQSRLKKKSQAEHAAQQRAKQEVAKGKGGATHASNGKGKAKAAPARTTIPYAPTDHILLIGEGNFSFAHALVCDPPKALCSAAGSPSSPGAGPSTLAVLPAANVTATAYDSEADCYSKYPSAPALVAALRARGATVLFGVDAARLDRCAPLRGQTFDRVVWNFPHAGAGIADQDRNVRANQRLVLAFLASAPAVLAQGALPEVHVPKRKKADENDEDENPAMEVVPEVEDQDAPPQTRGTVLITLRNVPPYTLWDVPKLAKSPPPPSEPHQPLNPRYKLLRSFAFRREAWPGYEHRMTKGERAGGTGTTGGGGEDRTWEFCLATDTAG